MLKATKVRIYPTTEQAGMLNRQFGSVRFAYNTGLRIMSHRYQRHGESLSAKHHIKKLLPVAKKSRKYGWLKQADSIALQQACINLDKAFQRFFDPKQKASYPRFKSKRGRQSSYHCVGVKAGDSWIKVPKLKAIKARIHRPIAGKLKSITLSRTVTGKHYASLLFETEQAEPAPLMDIEAANVVGLDMGLSHLAIDSNGTKTANPRFIKQAQKNLKRKQQSLSRKTKGSAKRAKARLLVAKAHERVANARNDFQHKLSRQIVDDNQAVIVETLKVKNMMQNGKLARHIGDASWHALITKLAYKAKEQGKHLVKIDQWFPSSKTCHACQHKMASMPLNVRSWDCPHCASSNDRDINAALNIKCQGLIQLKAEGLSVSAH
ncbi:RNA-guided endonuclease InsQ/TnpB family protein [Vreelandella subglaciescola]|jgi:putative transposase|uniref:Putative transposase n=1 Tax=Vreelandella subglaciescola TaxID=29571 RepID=A0A1M7FTR0_9GAMM|nr:RNA-guided endonuclease TnpB family protein [Halomonas subglaciescola]SHM07386.1 putative transposase [Halomonas subglaciescola]